MKTEEALQILTNVAEAANKAGLFNLNDSISVVQALAVISESLALKQVKKEIKKEE